MEFSSSIPIKKSWGQNFIQDKNTINKIIKTINPDINENIIEIGPGKGALTFPLSKKIKHLTAIEIDPLLVEFLNTKNIKNISIINQDFLLWQPNFKNKIKIVGNLPYYISSPIIFKLIKDNIFSELTLMIQKELALRMCSKPNCKDYSRMSIVSQAFCDINYKFDVSKNIFKPKPKVDSAVIQLKRKKIDLSFNNFSTFIKQAFNQRRKKLKNNFKEHILEDSIGNKRPENITVKEYISLYHKYFF